MGVYSQRLRRPRYFHGKGRCNACTGRPGLHAGGSAHKQWRKSVPHHSKLGDVAGGKAAGAANGIAIDGDGKSVWVADRCGTGEGWVDSKVDPIQKFDESGKLLIVARQSGGLDY